MKSLEYTEPQEESKALKKLSFTSFDSMDMVS